MVEEPNEGDSLSLAWGDDFFPEFDDGMLESLFYFYTPYHHNIPQYTTP